MSADLIKRAQQAKEALYKLAREDVNVFCELVATDDETGDSIKQAPIHRIWHKLADEHKRLIIWSHIQSGKTTQLSVLRTVWELGRNPNLRFIIVSATAEMSGKIVKAIANLIENNEAVKAIFPDLKPDRDAQWTGSKIRVKRTSFAKDPSVTGIGVHGAIVGARADRLILDDILGPENTRTPELCRGVIEWYRAAVLTRLTKDAKILCVGTAWKPEDLYHVLAREGFTWKRFPVINAKGVMTWPEVWPMTRIEDKKKELGPLEFARNLLCKARDDNEARFQEAWFDKAKKAGEKFSIVHELEEVPPGCFVFTGVDLAFAKNKKSDITALFHMLVYPDGKRRILKIEAGKWNGPDTLARIENAFDRYGSIFVVESVAAQIYLLQFAHERNAIPIIPFITTGNKKWDPTFGVESIAVEVFNGSWILPSRDGTDPEIEKWIEECLFFSPNAHTGDRLMASWFAVWEARRRMRKVKKAAVNLRIVG